MKPVRVGAAEHIIVRVAGRVLKRLIEGVSLRLVAGEAGVAVYIVIRADGPALVVGPVRAGEIRIRLEVFFAAKKGVAGTSVISANLHVLRQKMTPPFPALAWIIHKSRNQRASGCV